MPDWFSISGFFSLAACAAWAIGGWLLVRSFFRLRPGEALAVGASAGFVLNWMGINLLAHFLPLPLAGLAAAAGILLVGLASAWRSRLPWPELKSDLSGWPQLAILAALAALFAFRGQGVSFPENNPSHAAATAFTLLLGWAWVRRFTRSGTAATLGSFGFVFAGGTRWLLALLPSSVLQWASSGVQLTAAGAAAGPNLVAALARPLVSQGQGGMPFPFAYLNGNFQALFFSPPSSGALPFVTALLLLLLSQTRPSLSRPAALALYALIFASLAWSAGSFFVLWWGSIAVVLLLRAFSRPSGRLRMQPLGRDERLGWLAILALSGLLSLLPGGYIIEALRALAGSAAPVSSGYGLGLRWPPAILNGQLGPLSLFNPRQLLVLVLELGPALLLAPLDARWAWKAIRRGENWQAGLGLAALLGMIFAFFVDSGIDATLRIWLVLAFPIIAFYYPTFRPAWKAVAVAGYSASVLSGLVLFAIQITHV